MRDRWYSPTAGSFKKLYEGPLGQEHLVKEESADGRKEIYEGTTGQEHLVKEEYANVWKDEGTTGQEHVVKVESADRIEQKILCGWSVCRIRSTFRMVASLAEQRHNPSRS